MDPRANPFTDRLTRDIRNDLSGSLMEAIDRLDIEPVLRTAARFSPDSLQAWHRGYLEERLERYGSFLQELRSAPPLERRGIAALLWRAGLYFELHEFLEQYWMKSSGALRLGLQALIRAGGVHVHLESGHLPAARSMAMKALAGLEEHGSSVEPFIAPGMVRDHLRQVLAHLAENPQVESGQPEPAKPAGA